ncbi:MAG: family 16 glycoside hydrolase [Planctomycetota bacterium]
MRFRRCCRVLLAASCLLAFSHPALGQDKPLVVDDPDFALQGEYVDSKRGLQVIARGDGEFDVVSYAGGLPGAGWDGKQKDTLEVDIDQLEAMLGNFKRVDRRSPTLGAEPPSGAVVLFDGTPQSLADHWKNGAKIVEGDLLKEGCTSKDTFGDYRLHLEFRLPFMPNASGQARGNSGVYHQGRFETQVLDSFGLEGKNNEAGGIYSIRDPDMNACLPPMVWQTYDVDFTAARWDASGKKTANAKITVKLNGFVVHRDVELKRTTTAAPMRDGPENGPIYLQDHGNPVRYRNIWVLPRDVDAEARRPIVPAFERFHAASGSEAVAGGRLLIAELNCVACHEADTTLVADIEPKQAPILDNLGDRARPEWILRYLADPHSTKPGTMMPDLLATMSEQDRQSAATALTHFLVGNDSIVSGGKGGKPREGEKLFHEVGCVACHMPRNGKQASNATSIPLVGIENKYTRASLAAFLKNPHAVRPSGRMPKIDLPDESLLHIAQYLTGDDEVTIGPQQNLPEEANMRFEAYHRRVDRLPDFSGLTPDAVGTSRGLDIGVGKRDTAVVLRFFGELPIKTAGTYRFALRSDDGSKLYIDNKLIVDNDGVHGEVTKEGKAQLESGVHMVRVEWFEKDGGEALKLDWTGPGINRKRLDHSIVMPETGEAALANLKPAEVDPDAFVFDARLGEKGKRLFTSLGCANCHQRTEDGSRLEPDSQGPTLASLNTESGCLSSNGKSPRYDLIGVQSDAIASAIVAARTHPTVSSDQQLVHRMKASNCYACHKRDEVGGIETDRNPFFVSTIPEMGDEGRLPPPLDGVGDKLQKGWIKNVVANGNKSRPYMKTYMPSFGAATGDYFAEALSKADLISEPHGATKDEPESRRVAMGRKLVGAKGLACVSCHTYGKFKSTGIQAIALDTMAQRIRQDWFHRYLPDPQKYRPGTRMPTGYPKGVSTVTNIYDGDRELQLTAMWSFLKKGTAGGVPEGITGGMIELKPTDNRPVLYRNFIEGVSPRGIAVGYPEAVNVCWDADTMSLGLIWQDRFIDAAKHWVGRGPGKQTPLGGNVVAFEKTTPVAALASESDPWPSASPREIGYRFLGYRLDSEGRPTFRYRLPEATVEDTPIPVAGELSGTLTRAIVITPADQDGKTLYFRAARGKIEPSDDGWFNINGTYRLRLNVDGVVRQSDGASELLVPITKPTKITQEILW